MINLTIIMRFSQGEREEGGTMEYRAGRGKDGTKTIEKELFDVIH